MGFDKWTTGDIAVEGDLNQLIAAWEGEAAAGQPFQCVEVDDATKYAGDFKNKNASGLALRAKDNAGNDIFDATKDKVKISKAIELAAGIKTQRLAQMYQRQGDNTTSDWDAYGTDTIDVSDMTLLEVQGVARVTVLTGSRIGNVVVTFPTAFRHRPVVAANVIGLSPVWTVMYVAFATDVTTTTVKICINRDATSGDIAVNVLWRAIGEGT